MGGTAARGCAHPGRAVQVEPIKPVLKAPGSMLFNLRYDGPHSFFASWKRLDLCSRDEDMMDRFQILLAISTCAATLGWVDRAYHALYSTRIPATENKTPWHKGGRGGEGQAAADTRPLLSSTLAVFGH